MENSKNVSIINILQNINSVLVYTILGIIAALFIAVIVLLIIVLVNQSRLTKKYNAFMSGNDAKTMEDAILKRFRDIDRLLAADAKKDIAIREIGDNLNIAYQKIGIIKYDAFKEMGGKLSFALALLDKENTGFVMNAMHSREGCYTYIKEIIKGEAFIALGDEEKKAVDMAIKADNFKEE